MSRVRAPSPAPFLPSMRNPDDPPIPDRRHEQAGAARAGPLHIWVRHEDEPRSGDVSVRLRIVIWCAQEFGAEQARVLRRLVDDEHAAAALVVRGFEAL